MKVFVDTNIMLDVLLDRQPFAAPAARIWGLCEREAVEGYISAISHNNCHYLIARIANKTTADQSIRLILDTFRTVPVGERIVRKALDAGFGDFEDAIQYYSAIHTKADFLVTRNASDFPKEPVIPILAPEDLLQMDLS